MFGALDPNNGGGDLVEAQLSEAYLAVRAVYERLDAIVALAQAFESFGDTNLLKTDHFVTKISGPDAADRTLGNKLEDLLSVLDYTTMAKADASGKHLRVPYLMASTALTGAQLKGVYVGPGQLVTGDGNKRGRYFANIDSPPSSLGNEDSIDTAFNGDLSRCLFPIEHRITGLGTLGTPAWGYLYTPETAAINLVTYIDPDAGHNESLTGNEGRTGGVSIRVEQKHYGNGDGVSYNASVLVAGNKAGATDVLAQPAGVILNGDMVAGNDHVYLNSLEFYMRDNGHDIAAAGPVINMERTNATGSQKAFWYGVRIQSKGTAPIDAAYSLVGKVRVGLDMAGGSVDLGPTQGAVSLAANQRFYLNNASTNGYFTNVFNGDYIEYNSGLGGIHVVAGGSSRLQVKSDQVTINGAKLLATGKVGFSGIPNVVGDVAATAAGLINGEVYHTDGLLRINKGAGNNNLKFREGTGVIAEDWPGFAPGLTPNMAFPVLSRNTGAGGVGKAGVYSFMVNGTGNMVPFTTIGGKDSVPLSGIVFSGEDAPNPVCVTNIISRYAGVNGGAKVGHSAA